MKKLLIYVVALMTFGLMLSTTSQAGLNDGLVAYWKFDNCTATDYTGNGYDGVMHGSPACEDGVHQKALFIDPDNDYIELNKTLGPDNIRALSFFINSKGPASPNKSGTIIGKYHWHNGRSFRVWSYQGDTSAIGAHFYARGDAYDGDKISSFYEDPDSLNPEKYTIINNTQLETNAWKHVVVNITATEIEIWIDAKITNKVKRHYKNYYHSSVPVYIGNLFYYPYIFRN